MENKVEIELEKVRREIKRVLSWNRSLPVELLNPILRHLEVKEARLCLHLMKIQRLLNPPCYPGWAIGEARGAYIPVCARI